MMKISDWAQIHTHILQLEQEGLVTRTFRRLDPERQQTILNAILNDALEKGPMSLSIKQVAERAGVSVGSLYQYFGNRDGMLGFTVEICVRYMVDMFNVFRPMLAAMPIRDGLKAYLSGGIEWSQMQVGMIQFFLRAAYHGEPELADRVVRPVAVILQDTMRDMLTAAVERGEIRPDVDLEAAVRIVNTLMIAIGDSQLLPYLNNYYLVNDENVPNDRLMDALVALIMGGIGGKG